MRVAACFVPKCNAKGWDPHCPGGLQFPFRLPPTLTISLTLLRGLWQLFFLSLCCLWCCWASKYGEIILGLNCYCGVILRVPLATLLLKAKKGKSRTPLMRTAHLTGQPQAIIGPIHSCRERKGKGAGQVSEYL